MMSRIVLVRMDEVRLASRVLCDNIVPPKLQDKVYRVVVSRFCCMG